MERRILKEDELSEAIQELDGWSIDTIMLKKRLEFENFAKALAFVNKVGALAESADHHPDITFGWGYAEFSVTTHDRGGITDADIALASKIDQIQGQNRER